MRTTGNPRISVILTDKNSALTIRGCIESLINQDSPPYEILLIDAGSTDGTLDIAKSYPQVKIISAPGCKVWDGQRIGVENATGDYIAFTDPDMVLGKRWLSCSMKWVERGYPIVSGIRIDVGDVYNAGWNKHYPDSPWFKEMPERGLILSDLLLPRRLWYDLQKDKPFNYAFDVEIAFAATRQGIKFVITPEITAFHNHPLGSYSESFRKSFSYSRRAIELIRKEHGKTVSGGKTGIDVGFKLLVGDFIGINSVKGYQWNRDLMRSQGIDIGLLKFMFSRAVFKLGQISGILRTLILG